MAVVAILVVAVQTDARSQSRAQAWRIDTAASQLVVHVYAGGLLSPALHDHHFVPGNWSGLLQFDPVQPEAAEVELIIAANSLRDQQPRLSAEDIRTVEEQVRGPTVLDATAHPEIRFHAERLVVSERSSDADGETLRGTLVGTLHLRGERSEVRVPVHARWSRERLRVVGQTSFKQTDFRIRPYRRFLGTVSVRNEVEVEFALDAVPAWW
jgi:polyisoprenoid-binding protein YceI